MFIQLIKKWLKEGFVEFKFGKGKEEDKSVFQIKLSPELIKAKFQWDLKKRVAELEEQLKEFNEVWSLVERCWVNKSIYFICKKI